MNYTIRPILTGKNASWRNRITLNKHDGEQSFNPALAWFLEGGGRRFLVDTGVSDPAWAKKYHDKGSSEMPIQDKRIDQTLAEWGIHTDDIELIIFTHLHWDHCHNMKRFTKARYIVQKRELEFAQNPIPPYYTSYEHPILGIEPPYAGVEFELVEGEQEILPGIEVFPTPGHSPGHQSVAVSTEKGTYVIAGDAVMGWENFQGKEPVKYIPIGRYINMFDMWESFIKIDERADFVLPGHEIGVLEKEIYP